MSNQKSKMESNSVYSSEGQMHPIHGIDLIVRQEKPDANEIGLLAAQMQMQAKAFHKAAVPSKVLPTNGSGKPIDEESIAGRFGWAELEPGHVETDELAPNHKVIPFIYRQTDKYCSERVLKLKLLEYQRRLHPDIGRCSSSVRIYTISQAEVWLLNNINNDHCDGQFGETFTEKDRILSLNDGLDSYRFLADCHRILVSKMPESLTTRFGFFRVRGSSVIPFVLSSGQYQVPLFYFKNITENLMAKTQLLRGWDLSYLKFCCRLQGIPMELLSCQNMIVIPLDEIKNEFKESAVFEHYWPSSVETSKLLMGIRGLDLDHFPSR